MSNFRPASYQMLPPVVKNLIIINCIMALAQMVLPRMVGEWMVDHLALHYFRSDLFGVWQLLTHLFMHGSPGDWNLTIMHLFSNMFALWMFGSVLENTFGAKRFLQFYIICGLGAALCHLGVLAFEYEKLLGVVPEQQLYGFDNAAGHNYGIFDQATVGASGSVFGVLFAFGYLFPNTLLYLYFLVPIKAKWVIAAYAAFELFSGVRNSAGDNVAHFAHIGGMLFAFIILKFWQKRYGFRRQ